MRRVETEPGLGTILFSLAALSTSLIVYFL